MLSKFLAFIAITIAIVAIVAACTQRSALVLRQDTPGSYWPRNNTTLSGRYANGRWVGSPSRNLGSGGFRGGGPGSGK